MIAQSTQIAEIIGGYEGTGPVGFGPGVFHSKSGMSTYVNLNMS